MIIKREVDEKGKEIISCNADFWKEATQKYKSIMVVLDEAHALINSRKSMSKINIAVTDWLALLRRVLGSNDTSSELVLITQLESRIDVIARMMATAVQLHRCHYIVTCNKCGSKFAEHNETPDKIMWCPYCESVDLVKSNHEIEVFFFTSNEKYEMFKYDKKKTYYKRIIVSDITKYFKYYNTLQWENLLNIY